MLHALPKTMPVRCPPLGVVSLYLSMTDQLAVFQKRALLDVETPVVVKASQTASTTWVPNKITVEGHEAVLSRIMHIVTLTV